MTIYYSLKASGEIIRIEYWPIPKVSCGQEAAYSCRAGLRKDNAGDRTDPPSGGALPDLVPNYNDPAAVAGAYNGGVPCRRVQPGDDPFQRP